MIDRPKRALIAYCVLADKLNTPGVGVMQALTPFLATACQDFEGEYFDAAKFSDAVAARYGIRIPRLAALGLAEQLAHEGLLEAESGRASSTAYKYKKTSVFRDASMSPSVTETEVSSVLASFMQICKLDELLASKEEAFLEKAFLERLLNVDSMRILVRREVSIATKKNADTLILTKIAQKDVSPNGEELHLDYLVSQFLIDLRDKDATAFERVSNVAFANMAAEAIACFRAPDEISSSLSELTIYLDTPLLLDMLGVNAEYEAYGTELLVSIKASGAKVAVFDHCVLEAESAVTARLSYLRSGINRVSENWGTSSTSHVLNALSGKVGDRVEARLKIEIHRDQEINLHKRASGTVGDIQTSMDASMLNWRHADAKDHDQKSVWAMLALRDVNKPTRRICDSNWLLLTRNTALIRIANIAWITWLQGTTRHSATHIESWAPIALSDKQFAGYLWARNGSENESISRARLLAHCSSAIRPRADIKARAYNLVLELNGKKEADDIAALLEDREAASALMRATNGDPEDVTIERLPFILEQMKLRAGEYAAAEVRRESAQQRVKDQLIHDQELSRMREGHEATQSNLEREQGETRKLELENKNLLINLAAEKHLSDDRKKSILQDGLSAGIRVYKIARGLIALLFGLLSALASWLATSSPTISLILVLVLGVGGFWFIPEVLHGPLSWLGFKRVRSVITNKDKSLEIPTQLPNFRDGTWSAFGHTPRSQGVA